MTAEELSDVSKSLLLPLDEVIADLYDKSLRYDARRFAAEVEKALVELPAIMDLIDIDSMADKLEEEIGEAIVKQLRQDG